jgi:hypothetical protein
MAIEATEKIKIGGLKFSDELVLVRLPEKLAAEAELPAVLSALMQQEINMSFFCADHTAPSQAGFCLARDDLSRCRAVFDAMFPTGGPHFDSVGAVGTLIIFPHQGKLAVLGRLLGVFGRRRLPLLSLCSSLSGLAVNTGYSLLEPAAAALQDVFELPDNHAPFRSESEACPADGSLPMPLTVPVETVASYWEPVIRIYGITRLAGLGITTVVFSEPELESLGEALLDAGSGLGRFDLALMHRLDDRRFRLMLCDRGGLASSVQPLAGGTDYGSGDLLSLHGPHFQDRYGVAHAAVSCLHRHGVGVRAVGCTGSSIYLVVPAEAGDAAARALADVFIVPKV